MTLPENVNQDTANTAETGTKDQANEVVNDSTSDAPVAPKEPTVKDEMVSRKELDKREMRINQLENQLAELVEVAKVPNGEDNTAEIEALRAKLEAVGGELDSVKRTKAEEEEQERFNQTRERLVGEYPEAKEVLHKIIDTNPMAVYPVNTFKKAENGDFNYPGGGFDSYSFDKAVNDEMKAQLEVITSNIKSASDQNDITIDAGNPSITQPRTGADIAVSSKDDMGEGELEYLTAIRKDDFKKLQNMGDF